MTAGQAAFVDARDHIAHRVASALNACDDDSVVFISGCQCILPPVERTTGSRTVFRSWSLWKQSNPCVSASGDEDTEAAQWVVAFRKATSERVAAFHGSYRGLYDEGER